MLKTYIIICLLIFSNLNLNNNSIASENLKENLNEIMSIAKKTSRWKSDSAEAELRFYKNHCITKDYKKVRRIGGCGYDIDARTFLDIKMVSEVISNKYANTPKVFWEKLIPLRKEITQNYLKNKVAKKEQSNQIKQIEFNKYLVAVDNCEYVQNKDEGWVYRNVCDWASQQWLKTSKAPYLMHKAWAQNSNGDYGWSFGVVKSQAKRLALKKCNKKSSNKDNPKCEVTSINEYDLDLNNVVDPRLLKRIANRNSEKQTQFAKTEFDIKPKKKSKVAKAEEPKKDNNGYNTYIKLQMTAKVYDSEYFNDDLTSTVFTFADTKNVNLNDRKNLDNFFKEVFRKTIDKCKRLNTTFVNGVCTVTTVNLTYLNSEKKNQSFVNKKGFDSKSSFFELINNKTTQIAKDEKKQEEFKPKNNDIDNEAPVIKIAENITVNDSTYEISGEVVDQSKKLFIEVEGQTIPVKKGKFKLQRFSPIDEQIKIVAIDQWGNRSKPKTVNIKIDIKNIEVVEKLEPLNPRKLKTKTNKNKVALIIGIEKYEQTPAANFANLDAKYFYEYARKAFGISKSNIKLLIDEDANLVKSLGTLNKWLPGKIKSDETELIIFFAGHGLASSDGKELYILPQDSDPDLLTRTALSRTELFKEILSLNPKSVTMFMDTCYSGISRDEKMLLASARPIRIVASNDEGIPDHFTIFSASKLDQISSGLSEASHGIFSYYLMKGLEGKADLNSDRKITNGELLSYLDDNVSQKASELGRQQNPSFTGVSEKILIRY